MKRNIRDIIKERVANTIADLDLTEEQRVAILQAIEPARSGVYTKINDAGDVWCNYFKKYLPASEFRLTKTGKYPPFSIEGEKLKRKEALLERKLKEELANDLLENDGRNKKAILEKYNRA